MEIATWAQIDSGADLCLFPGQLASPLGITIPNDRPRSYEGVGGTQHTAYFDSLEVGILNWPTEEVLHTFEIEAGFSDALDARGSGILGIHGFFSQFRVTFLRYHIEIQPF